MTFEWIKTARGMWEAKNGQLRGRIELDNGLYRWQAWHGEESLGTGRPRNRKVAEEQVAACVEESMRPKCCLEQGFKTTPV